MSAIANASASTPAHCATVARSGNRTLEAVRRLPIMRLAEERDAPPRHDATHFEVRERDVAYGI